MFFHQPNVRFSPRPARGRGKRQRRPAGLWEACESRLLLATGPPGTNVVAILDAPPVPRPDTGFALATFQVTLTPANIESPVSVNYATADNTAKAANNDYVPTSGQLTFMPEETTKTIQVVIPARTQAEFTKTFFVNLTGDATIGRAQGLGTIVDTHPAGQVQFSSSNYTVNPDGNSATITINRVNGRASDVGVTFTTTTGGTAVPGVDYKPTTRVVTFGLNKSSVDVTVPINAQATPDQPVTVSLLLEGPSGQARLGTPSRATLTIVPNFNPLIVTTTADDGRGSLRQAIAFADTLDAPTPPRIRFAITREGPGIHTITPTTRLPAITRPTTIDATTQPGFVNRPVIVLNGALLQVTDNGPNPANGLDVTAGGTTILGFAVNAFPGSAIVLEGPGGDRVTRNVLGTDPSGRTALPNLGDGVFINGSSGNTVSDNQISGNANVGVQVLGRAASGNTITGNRIGTDARGLAAVPNRFDGVFINDAPGTTVAGNLISGNGNVGVQLLSAGAMRNVVRGNLIGTNLAGNAALPNVDGVFINNAPGNTLANNLISGNSSVGVQVLGSGASANTISGNRIGTDLAGNVAVANASDGVFLNNAPANTVSGNLVSGNRSVGVQVFGPGSSGNTLSGNVIGLGSSGRALGNGYGVFLNGNSVPGPGGPEGQNTIRGNRVAQVFRSTPGANAVTSRTVFGRRFPTGRTRTF